MTAVSESSPEPRHGLLSWLIAIPMMVACAPGAGGGPLIPRVERLPQPTVEIVRAPFYAVDASGRLDVSAVVTRLGRADLVCLGERHDNIVHHALQLQLVEALQTAALARGAAFALGLEMFQLPSQPALDAYATFELDEAGLLTQSEYATRWGYDFGLYRAILESVRARKGELIALNAPREWTKAVARQGLPALHAFPSSPKFSDLNLNDEEHRAFFLQAMSGHGHGHGSFRSTQELATDPFYAAQIVWDEVMAQSAASWLSSAPSGAQIVVLAGSGHCHRSAIPRRVERRLPELAAIGVRLTEQAALTHNQVPANSAFDMVLVAVQP